MPQDRLRSPRGSHGRRLTSLTDFEFRCWDQYQLSADDFGVMRCSAVTLQADNDNLADRPSAEVQAAIERLVEVGLVLVFTHQERRYVCQADWQAFQKVEYPRTTTAPRPPDSVLEQCDAATQRLFRKHPGGWKGKKRKGGNGSSAPAGIPEGRAEGMPEGRPEGSPEHFPKILPKPLAVSVSSSKSTSSEPPRGGGALAGMLPRDHVNHAACDPGFAWCVPSPVHLKLTTALAPRHGGDRAAAAAALQAWYPTVWASLAPDFVFGDGFRFWSARFEAAFASPDHVQRPNGRPEPITASPVLDIAAMRRGYQAAK